MSRKIGVNFLHNHPSLELTVHLNSILHVIIDRDDWEEVIKFFQTYPEREKELLNHVQNKNTGGWFKVRLLRDIASVFNAGEIVECKHYSDQGVFHLRKGRPDHYTVVECKLTHQDCYSLIANEKEFVEPVGTILVRDGSSEIS